MENKYFSAYLEVSCIRSAAQELTVESENLRNNFHKVTTNGF